MAEELAAQGLDNRSEGIADQIRVGLGEINARDHLFW